MASVMDLRVASEVLYSGQAGGMLSYENYATKPRLSKNKSIIFLLSTEALLEPSESSETAT